MDISVSVNLPPELEKQLDPERTRLTVVAREAVVVDLFRRGTLSHVQLGQALGLDRFETDALLKRHEVTEHTLSHQEADADLRSINELIGPPRS
jgi:predicted HTH domain antitoxin